MSHLLIRSRASVPAFAALLAGCTLQPDYVRPDPAIAVEYPSGPAYAANPPATGARLASDIGWREFLTDPRLQHLVEIALKNNQDLRTAVLNVEVTRAQLRIQSAALYPQLDAVAERERLRSPRDVSQFPTTNFTTNTVGLSVAWELDVFGQLRSLKESARQQYLASIQGQRAAQIMLVSQVADQYLSMLAFDALLDVTERTLQTARDSYDIVKLQYDTGVVTELDLRQAETVVEQARSNRAAQLRARAQAENGLIELLGQPQPPLTSPPVRLGEEKILADIPAGMPSELLTRRPDVLQAEALLRSANADIGAARAAFFPNITLTGMGGTASSTLSDLFQPGTAAWSWAASITESIFDGGANRANLDATHARKEIGVAQYQKTIQTAFREVADGLAARGTFDEQIASLERNAAAERRRLDLAQLLYKNGEASYLDVLTAQTDLYSAEQLLVSARLDRLTNIVDLYRALGGGWQERS